MRRPKYMEGVAWIALNDAAGDDQSAEEIAMYISTLLVADLFGVEAIAVAEDVVKFRQVNSQG